MRRMSEPSYKLRSPEGTYAYADPSPSARPDRGDDPFLYGWRWRRSSDGKLRAIPLSYEDLLDPQEGDCVSEDSIHRAVVDMISGILSLRYADQPSVAIWSNLKVAFRIPDVTEGPAPDVYVVEGVRDRGRRRRSFRPEEEPGAILLGVEVVSKSSVKKDYEDLLGIYAKLGMAEYVAVRAKGLYLDGAFEIRLWRRDAKRKRLVEVEPDGSGRFLSEKTGLLFGTGSDGKGLVIFDAAKGERLRAPLEEAAWQRERAVEAERLNREMKAEIERLRAQLRES